MKLHIEQPELANLRNALSREWLETNGLGGYASGTIANCHTRKYHGLLVASLAQPAGTFVLLSRLDDQVEVNGKTYALSTNQYGETFAPDGYLRQLRFEQEHCPAFVYNCGGLTITRRIMMVQGQNTVLVRYEADGDEALAATLRLRPLLAFRSIHAITRANSGLNPQAEAMANGFSVQPYAGMPTLFVQTNLKPVFTAESAWYYNFKYAADAERGFEHIEDQFTPGLLTLTLKPGKPVIFSASTEPATATLTRLWQQEEARRIKLADADATAFKPDWDDERRELFLALRQAGRQFEIETPTEGPAIQAGYHWFGPWGRDTIIALPGLTFLQPGADLARGVKILKAFVKYEKRGLLPNFINADGTGVYTAADTSLWFFWAVQQYLAAGGEHETVRRFFWPTMIAIIRNFMAGTDNGIAVDADGLLRAGTPSTTVTWMDSQVGGRPIIPRWGYMVEINALWYNALVFTLELAKKKFRENIEDMDSEYVTHVRFSFVRKFWDAENKRLLDTVNESSSDTSLRPNSLLAVSLPNSPLSVEQQKAVVKAVKAELFTPYGLRSLSPHDIRYRSSCQGENWVRELAYNQGSVWPWFLAHFAEALLKTEPKSRENPAIFNSIVAAFDAHILEGGIGSVSEVFDGDAPHAPRGSIAQAWNVAELLRFLQVTG